MNQRKIDSIMGKYEVEGFYDLPDNWKWVLIDDIFDVRTGITLNAKRRQGKSLYPFLRTRNVYWGYLDLSSVDQVDFSEAEVKRLSLKKGDLLFCEGGEVGRSAIWNGDIENCCHQNHVHRLRKKNSNIYPEFYMYWMQYAFLVLKLYEDKSSTTTIKNLSSKKLKAMKVPLPFSNGQPDIALQQKIVQRIEELFRKSEQVYKLRIEAKEQTSKLLLKAILKFVSYLKRENTEWVKLKDIGEILIGKTPRKSNQDFYGGNYPFFKPADLNMGYHVINSNDRLSEMGKDAANILPPKSVLVTCIGATIGKTGFIRVEGAFNQQINAIIPNQNFMPEFVYFICISNYFQQQIIDKAIKTTLPILNKSNFSNLRFPKIAIDEQREIVDYLEKIHKKQLELLSYFNNTESLYTKLKRSILHKAFKGELVN